MKKLFLGAAALLVWAIGCAVGPNYHRPEIAAGDAFANGSATATNRIHTAWWNGFNDALLTRLVVTATTNNHSIRLAESRLREARALWREARFDFAPTVRSENFYQNNRTAKDSLTNPNADRDGELYRVGFDASWELDLWGRVRREVEAARATVESVEANRDDVLVTIQAEVAANYFELRGLQAQLNVASRNATNQAQILKLADALLQGGGGTRFDVARARSLLNQTLASIPPLEASIQQAIHRLSVLCGFPPGKFTAELKIPADLPLGPNDFALESPTDLVRLRPDVRAAERSLAAATARVGIEVADLFPRVTFVGTIGLQARNMQRLTESGADTFGFGPHISWAAFDLGRVRQRIKAANARAEGALVIYEQTALLALEETENSLVTFGRERQRLEYLRESERAAAEATELARQRYRDGIADFISVLDAERTLLSLQDQLAVSETRAATSLVGVYKSFAGGFGR